MRAMPNEFIRIDIILIIAQLYRVVECSIRREHFDAVIPTIADNQIIPIVQIKELGSSNLHSCTTCDAQWAN